MDAAAPRAQEAAQAFAEAYVAYLDGRRAAAALPYSTLTSRQQAVEGGEIPAGLRTHPARVQAVEPEGSTSVTAQYVVAVAAGRRSYPFKMRLAWGSDGWRVTGLQPPDMTQANATPAPAPPGPSTALRAAAREFALAYVNYTSGVRRTPPEGEPVLLRQIEAGGDPLVGAKVPRVPATLAGVLYGPVQSGRIAAEATVRAGGQTYTFSFVMQSTGQGWRASGFPTGQSG